MSYLHAQAADIMRQIDTETLQQALLDCYMDGQDPQTSSLYGAISVLLKHAPAVLQRPYTITQLHQSAHRIRERRHRTKRAQPYTDALRTYLIQE